jgi:hypothetical protein
MLLTGTVGVGKTSVLVEIGEALARADAAYAIVDLDWLAWLRPSVQSGASVQGVLATNLRLVTSSFRAAGVESLVLARAVRRADEVATIRDALGPSAFTVVRLVASPEVIASRLAGRDRGAQLAEHLAEASAFAAEAEAERIGDVLVSTDERSVEWVAQAVLAGAGWSGGSSAPSGSR